MLKFALTSIFMVVVAGGYALAESTADSLGVPGEVECDAFKLNPNGSWTVTRQTVVTIGSDQLELGGMTFDKQGIRRGAVTFHVFVGPNDLADVLDRTCKYRS
jgi:hypothetical protein